MKAQSGSKIEVRNFIDKAEGRSGAYCTVACLA